MPLRETIASLLCTIAVASPPVASAQRIDVDIPAPYVESLRPHFTDRDIRYLHHHNVPLETVAEVGRVAGGSSDPAIVASLAASKTRCGTPIEDIAGLYAVELKGTDEEKSVMIERYFHSCGSLRNALESISLADGRGKRLISTWREFREYSSIIASNASGLKDAAPVMHLHDREDLRSFLESGGNGDYLALLGPRTDGRRYTLDMLRAFMYMGFSAEELDSFRDTEKPNASLIVAKADDDGVFRATFGGLVDFIKTIKQEYDWYVTVAHAAQEGIDTTKYVQDVELIVWAAHGSRKEMTIGNGVRDGALRYGDKRVKEHLDRASDAVRVVLFSCSTGEGKGQTKNMAGWMKLMAPDATIFAPPFDTAFAEVSAAYPIDVLFHGKGGVLDAYIP